MTFAGCDFLFFVVISWLLKFKPLSHFSFSFSLGFINTSKKILLSVCWGSPVAFWLLSLINYYILDASYVCHWRFLYLWFLCWCMMSFHVKLIGILSVDFSWVIMIHSTTLLLISSFPEFFICKPFQMK